MSRRINPSAGRRNRRRNTYIWIAVMTIATIALIKYEQTALLYILATLGVTALLIIVALADLKHAQLPAGEGVPPADDAAAIGSSITSTLTGTATTQVRGARSSSRRR